ncbi:esterase E4-like [Planococcus citri]|uniref:esterase E4-like n=1 Tax=Planococcus citri TaxID=170843 RepID=UPI0031F75E9A
MYKFLIIAIATLSVESLIVTINQGIIDGTHSTTRSGKIFNAFYGIPFAQPPTGRLRFKSPKEAKPWKGVLNSTTPGPVCLNIPQGSTEIVGDEDCLNLNVYSPLNARQGDNLAVIVYIFGGAFKWSSNMDFGPEYLLDQNVIVVVPNYRLGALGLLSTGDTVISGNYQLKDQTMALKWVQQNIRHFGGDPSNVALHGYSSGAACVHLHTLSPASKGLFHRVIMHSNAEAGIFYPYKLEVIRGIVKEFATKAGCPDVTTSENIHKCLMALDGEVFPVIEQSMTVWDQEPTSVFQPSTEDKNSEEPFLTDPPSSAQYHSPSMPWIVGLTTGEGAYKAANFLQKEGELAAEIDQYYKILFPLSLAYLWNTKLSYLNFISQVLRVHYFGNRKIGAETSHEMTELYSHGLFGVPVIRNIRSYPGPKYVYLFDYRSNYTTQNDEGYYEEFLGISHGDDVILIYYTEKSNLSLTNQDHMFSEELVKRWVNFVQTGNPNHPLEINEDLMDYWKPMISDRIEYLRINLNGSMETDLYKGTYDFWKSLPIGVV